jgi:predicted nucleotidyltransferase
VVLTILENLDFIIYGTNQKNIHDAMLLIKNDSDMQREVEEEFGVPFEIISLLFSMNVINQVHVEMIYDMV